MTGVFTKVAVESCAGQEEPFADSFIRQSFVPARQSFLTVSDILTAQHFVERIAQRDLAVLELSFLDNHHRKMLLGGNVILVLLLLFVPPLQTRGEKVGG